RSNRYNLEVATSPTRRSSDLSPRSWPSAPSTTPSRSARGPTDEPGQGRGLLRARQAVRAPRVATARGGARRRPHPRRARHRRRVRPPPRAGRRAIAPARRRLDLRPRDDRPGVPARRARPDGLAGAPAQGRLPRRLHLLLPLRALLRLPRQRARGVSGEDRAAARAVRVPALPRRVRRVLLSAAALRALPRPRRAARRDGCAGELRPLA